GEGGDIVPPSLDYQESRFADVDGDGKADLMSVGRGRVIASLSTGNDFGPVIVSMVSPPAGDNGNGLVVCDLNGDHVPDFVQLSITYCFRCTTIPSPIVVALGHPNGTMTDDSSIPHPSFYW